MIRMIAEKLSGQAGMPQDVIAVEEPEQARGVSPAAAVPTQWLPPSSNPSCHSSVASPTNSLAEIFDVLTYCDWWGLAQMMLFIGVAVLMMAIEQVQEV